MTSAVVKPAQANQIRPVIVNGVQIGYIDGKGQYHGSTVDGDGNIVPPAPEPTPLRDFLRDLWDAIRKPTQQELLDRSNENSRRSPRAVLDILFPPAHAGEVPNSRFEETCRNPNFPRDTPPTYRIIYVDPLAIDLDGDGIETTGIGGASTVVFDHDGDRLKTGTGWLAGDDAWLVRDLNGNGQIDSGAEMFGDQTILPDSRKAVSGLHALGALNSNADNKINSADAAFSELRIWQDLNQNGITDAGELKTLAEAGITEISLSASQPSATNSVTVDGGHYRANHVVRVTRDDGSTTSAYDLSTTHDGFYSEFMDPVEVPEALRGLPNIAGMGRLRDLREAAALSPALADKLQAYTNATTRAEQQALVDDLLTEWAKTDPQYDRTVMEEMTSWGMQDPNSTNIIYVRRSAAASISRFLVPPAPTAADAEFSRDVRVMDALRGTVSGTFYARGGIDWRAEYDKQTKEIEQALYDSLLAQTRLKPYLDSLELTIDEQGVRFDFAALNSLLDQRYDQNRKETVIDLAELVKTQGADLIKLRWQAGPAKLRDWIDTNATDTDLQLALRELNVKYLGGDSRGTAEANVLLGKATSDQLSAGAGDDILDGGAGDDILNAGTCAVAGFACPARFAPFRGRLCVRFVTYDARKLTRAKCK